MAASRYRFYLYDNSERRFVEIYDGFVCGRSEGELQFPQDNVVSRRQCQFHVHGNDVYVEDLQSTNRTRVNNVPAQPGFRRRIQLNDVIEFGSQRLVLSNQDKFSPSNIQDGRDRVYKAARVEGGRLTSEVSQLLTKKTMLMLDRASFRKLRIGETLSRRPGGRRETDRTVDLGARRLARVLLVLLVLVWIAQLGSLGFGGALGEDLPHQATEIGLGVTWVWGAAAALALMVFVRIVLPLTGGAWARRAGLLATLFVALGANVLLADKSGLASRIAQNLAVTQCVRSWNEGICGVIAGMDHAGAVHLPAEMRVQIREKLPAFH